MLLWHKGAQTQLIKLLDEKGYVHIKDGCFALTQNFTEDRTFYYHTCGWNDPSHFNWGALKTGELDADILHAIEQQEDKHYECSKCTTKIDPNVITMIKMIGYANK